MKRLSITIAFVLGAASFAEAAMYCAKYSDGTQSCGIPTLESCEQSVLGVGGFCAVDDSAEIPRGRPGVFQRMIEQEQSDARPRSPDLDSVPPPPGN